MIRPRTRVVSLDHQLRRLLLQVVVVASIWACACICIYLVRKDVLREARLSGLGNLGGQESELPLG